MRIATFNVNGINGRLPRLLEWLAETTPDVVCLEELKAPEDRFPEPAINAAGYGAIWHGRRAGTASPSWPAGTTRWRPAAGCRAIRRTCTAATSRPR